jgi:voltage-gated potassium channel
MRGVMIHHLIRMKCVGVPATGQRFGVSSGAMSERTVGPAPRRLIARACAQIAVSTGALLVCYYLVPLDRADGASILGWLVIGLATFVAVAVAQIRGILRAPYPALRAITGFGVALPLLVLVFAATYLTMSAADPSAFSERLSHTDALYFAVTILSTVGFGDITPATAGARVVVMVQMVSGLLVLGLLARVVIGAVQESRQRMHGPHDTDRPE